MTLRTLLFSLLLSALAVQAAINPEEYIRQAPCQVRLKEKARLVEKLDHGRFVRTTLLAEVVEVRRGDLKPGDSVLVDWTVDTTALAKEREEHQRENGTRPGPQFMYEPEAPALDESGQFWANLAPMATRYANVQRHAGAVVNFTGGKGPLYVPVSGQYSFLEPAAQR